MKTYFTLFVLILGTLFISSCESTTPCPDSVDKGNVFYTQKSFEALPYVGKSNVIFKNELAEELAFSVVDLGDTIRSGRFAGTCSTNPGQRVYFDYMKKVRTIIMENDSINSQLYVWIDTELDFDSYSEYDKIKVSFTFPDFQVAQYFNMMVDQRNISDESAAEINSLIIYEPEIELLGRKYFDTYHMKYPDVNNTQSLYYNYEFGVVSFVDPEGTTWIFDRFE